MLCLFVYTAVWAQKSYETQYEVQYQVTFSMDSLHLDDKSTETLYLYTGSEYGVFMNYRKAKADKIQAEIERQIRSGSLVISPKWSSDFHKTFYKNLNSGKVKTIEAIARHDYLYTEPIQPEWQIMDSTKTILDYTVQKATTHFGGRDFVAWFTLQIPIHDGPYLFTGLPGLIVKLYNTEKEYVFQLKSIQKLDEPKTWTLPEAKMVSKAKFKKLKAKAARHVRGDLITVGGITMHIEREDGEMNPTKIRRRKRKKQARENNPLELQ